MLNPAELEQSAVKACVDALVDSGGGLLLYSHGLAGREALVAAGAQLAATADLPLTLVDAQILRDDAAAFLDQLGAPHHVFLSPAEAAHWPTGFTPNAVLAIHADVLLDPAVEEPLLAAAREASRAGHLLVARRPDGASLLDAHTVQTHQLIADSMTTTQTQAATGTPDRYEPGPLSGMPTRDDISVESPMLRISNYGPGPVAAALARSREQSLELRLIPPRWIPSNREQDAELGDWGEAFMRAGPPRPNWVSRETVQGLQLFFVGLQAPQAAERTPSRHEQPDATSTPYEPLADTSRQPAESEPPADDREGLQRPAQQTGSLSASRAAEHSPTYWLRTQTPAEREEGDWQKRMARKRRAIDSLLTPDTGSAQADALSDEELSAALENPDPDLLRRVQQQAENLQAQIRGREGQAAAAAHRSPRPPRAHQGTGQRHPHGQDQTTAQQPPHQRPGR